MTTNAIRARLEFSFRGEDYVLDATIDLDRCLEKSSEMPDFHHLLARAGNIDPYSYLYEVIESCELAYDQPVGLAADCCKDGMFDWPCFVAHACAQRDLQAVRQLAAQTLDMHEFETRPELRAALLAAYRAGRAGTH